MTYMYVHICKVLCIARHTVNTDIMCASGSLVCVIFIKILIICRVGFITSRMVGFVLFR